MSRNRTTPEKVADWVQAYRAISVEVTPPVLRQMLNTLQGAADTTTVEGALGLLQSSMALARLVSANDRAAAIAAAVLTSSGGAVRPIPDVEDV